MKASLEPVAARLLAAAGYDPVTADQLAERTGIAQAELAALLLELELRNQMEALPGGIYQRLS
jgi:DNA processing protein